MGDGLARVATQAAGWWSLARRWPRTDRSKSFRDCAGVSARSLVRSQAPSPGAKQSAVFLSSSARGAGMAAVARTTVQDSAPSRTASRRFAPTEPGSLTMCTLAWVAFVACRV